MTEELMRTCQLEKNVKGCPCSYEPCSRKGVCCECITYHWRNEELPACLFPESVERTYDRSLARFLEIHRDR
jgi:hypothetical protein